VPQRLHLSPPDVGVHERELLLHALDSGWISTVGPALAEFEAALAAHAGVRGVVALSSGTAALHLALLGVGVRPGDRVFTSTFTFAATANAIHYCGAEPVFIDSDRTSWNLDPDLLADALSAAAAAGRRPAAVLVVDLYGQCADHDRIAEVCAAHGVPIVEDAAEAVGATYRGRPAGSFGRVAAYSFNGNKIITTSGGGALLSDDTDLVHRARHLATQARQPVAHYEHHDIGFNYRMSNLLAAVGTAQLARLGQMMRRRHEVHAAYRAALGSRPEVTFMPRPDWSGWNAWLTCIVLPTPQHATAIGASLAADDIESRPLWKPMHLQPVFAHCEAHVRGVSDHLFHHGLCLPSGSSLTDTDVERVIAAVLRGLDSVPRT